MSAQPSARMLDDTRLHLHHGPIDLVIEAFGEDWQLALNKARVRFQTVLDELVGELHLLRQPTEKIRPKGSVAKRMFEAAELFPETFVTPMAAVAGAVADEICEAMTVGLRLEKAYVNNGGDIAVFLGQGQSLAASIGGRNELGRVSLTADGAARGLATSGWHGRSHSLGIADSVSVVAKTAAVADVAATLIANAVDLPGHPAVVRIPACELSPDSDLGDRLVTADVGVLRQAEVKQALAAGRRVAEHMKQGGGIEAAALFLKGEVVVVGEMLPEIIENPEVLNAQFQIA